MEKKQKLKLKKTTTKTIKIRKVKSNLNESQEKEDFFKYQQENVDKNINPGITTQSTDIKNEATIEKSPIELQNEETIKEIDLQINEFNWEYKMNEKKFGFYGFLFFVCLLLIFISYYYNNWFLALFVVLGFVLIAQRNSKIKQFRIDESGVYVQEHLIEWSNIKYFSLDSLENQDGLIILATNTFPFGKLYLPFSDEQHQEIFFLLEKYSTYKEASEGISDKIVRKILF